MNVLSVTQYTKPRFKDIQDRQKIAWIIGITISVMLNITLGVLSGIWNTERLQLKTDKKSLQNNFNQCQNQLYEYEFNGLQKTCNNTIYKAGDKIISFNYSQNVQPFNSNNITDTIEIKDNGDIYINNKEATTETCKILPEEIYLQKENNYYKYDISNFIKETPIEGTLQGTVNSEYIDGLVLKLNNKQIYPIDENVLGDKIYVTNNKYTTQGPGDYSLSVADNKITRDDIQIWPLGNINKISFKYSKDNKNYYYTLQGPQQNIYQGDIPANSSTNILSNITLGNNKDLTIEGTYGDNNLTDNGISITPIDVYGNGSSISINNKDGTLHNQININTIIDSTSSGIVIDKNTQFKNCQNGINISSKVNGSNSGILINADIGHVGSKNDVNSTYGIYQKSGTIQGTIYGFYQQGTINSNNNGISIQGTVTGKINAIQITGTVGDIENTQHGIYQAFGTIQGRDSGIAIISTIQGNTNGIYVNGTVKGSNSGIYLNGSIGHIGKANEKNSTYGIYQKSGNIYGTTSGIQINGNIQGNNTNSSNGIIINANTQFENYKNGIFINSTVKGSDSGIYINGTVGDDTNTKYGIQQNSGTIQGKYVGFYQLKGSISGGSNGILISDIVKSNRNGILIDSDVSFKDCENGLYINGNVTGSNSGIYLNGEIGDANNSKYGIQQSSESIIQGKITGIYQNMDSTIYGGTNGIYLRGTIQGNNTTNSNGIMIDQGAQFENYYNGILINGTVIGSNSGVYVNATIGDGISKYGIYQNSSGIVQGKSAGFYQQGSIHGGTYGLYTGGTVTGSTSGIQISGTVGDAENSRYGIYQYSGTIQGNHSGFHQLSGSIKGKTNGFLIKDTVIGNSNGIYLDTGVKFKECQNGINISGKVNGTNSGIQINGDIGHVGNNTDDVNSTYGIYQASGTIQGTGVGFYQQSGIIHANGNGISVYGNIKSDYTNGIYIDGNIEGNLNAINIVNSTHNLISSQCKIQDRNTCILNP